MKSLLAAASALIACACTHGQARPDAPAVPEPVPSFSDLPLRQVSLCELSQQAKDLVGVPVLLSATYHTDHARYEYFSDASCGTRALIEVSYTTGSGDESVKRLYGHLKDDCARRKLNYCADQAAVKAEVAIVKERSGQYTIDLRKVIDFEVHRP